MSTIVTDTITGKSTATTITIGSTPVVSASANSMTIRGEGSNQTSIQQGLVKNWIRYNGATNTINDSFNCGSVTDSATGVFINNYTNNMGNANYSFGEMSGFDTSGSDSEYARGLVTLDLDDITTSSMKVYNNYVRASAAANGVNDGHMIAHQIFGDLA